MSTPPKSSAARRNASRTSPSSVTSPHTTSQRSLARRACTASSRASSLSCEHDDRARAQELARDALADRARAAGDERDLACERRRVARLPSFACSRLQYSMSNRSPSESPSYWPIELAQIFARTVCSAMSAAMRAARARLAHRDEADARQHEHARRRVEHRARDALRGDVALEVLRVARAVGVDRLAQRRAESASRFPYGGRSRNR